VSRVVEHKPAERIELEHLGMINKGVEDYESDKIKPWIGATEIYTVTEEQGQVKLTIEQDMTEEYKAHFEKAWENALLKVKELAEATPAMA
jgi:hypothetical protein